MTVPFEQHNTHQDTIEVAPDPCSGFISVRSIERAANDSSHEGAPVYSGRRKRWLVLGQLGEGGQAVVYRARDASDPKAPDVALKLIKTDARGHTIVARQMIQREAALVESLPFSTHLLPVLDEVAVDGVQIGYVMPLCRLGSLAAHLDTLRERREATSRATVKQWFQQICAGLHVMHERGIGHFDVKLENFFLVESPAAPDGTIVCLGDLGIAGQPGRYHGGTPEAMAPEVARVALSSCAAASMFAASSEQSDDTSAITCAADVYSLGVALLRVLDPDAFAAEQKWYGVDGDVDLRAMLEARARGEWPALSRRRLDSDLHELFQNVLSLDASKRPSILEFSKQLELLTKRDERATHVVWAMRNLLLPIALVVSCIIAALVHRAHRAQLEQDRRFAVHQRLGDLSRDELLQRIGGLLRVVEATRNELTTRTTDLTVSQQNHQRTIDELNGQRTLATRRRSELDSLRGALAVRQSQLAAAQDELVSTTAARDATRALLDMRTTELGLSRELAEGRLRELDRERTRTQTLQNDLDARSAELRDARSSLASKESELRDRERERDEARTSARASVGEARAAEARVGELNSTIAGLRAELNELRERASSTPPTPERGTQPSSATETQSSHASTAGRE